MPKLPQPPPTPQSPSQQPTDATLSLRSEVERVIFPLLPGSNQQKGQVVERVVSIVEEQIFSGPLPHPRHLAEYEKITPGLADRIVAMAELSQRRNEDRMDNVIGLEFGDRRLGMYLGFAALTILVIAGATLLLAGQTIAGGGVLGTTVLGTIVANFIHGRPASPPPKKRPPADKKPPKKASQN